MTWRRRETTAPIDRPAPSTGSYEVRADRGGWSVYDRRSDQLAWIYDVPCIFDLRRDAESLACVLNHAERSRRWERRQ